MLRGSLSTSRSSCCSRQWVSSRSRRDLHTTWKTCDTQRADHRPGGWLSSKRQHGESWLHSRSSASFQINASGKRLLIMLQITSLLSTQRKRLLWRSFCFRFCSDRLLLSLRFFISMTRACTRTLLWTTKTSFATQRSHFRFPSCTVTVTGWTPEAAARLWRQTSSSRAVSRNCTSSKMQATSSSWWTPRASLRFWSATWQGSWHTSTTSNRTLSCT